VNLPPRPVRNGRVNRKEGKKSWEFEANKVLLVEGKVSFEDAGAYRISLENLTGSVVMKSPRAGEFVFAADSLGRRDVAVELGESRLLGPIWRRDGFHADGGRAAQSEKSARRRWIWGDGMAN